MLVLYPISRVKARKFRRAHPIIGAHHSAQLRRVQYFLRSNSGVGSYATADFGSAQNVSGDCIVSFVARLGQAVAEWEHRSQRFFHPSGRFRPVVRHFVLFKYGVGEDDANYVHMVNQVLRLIGHPGQDESGYASLGLIGRSFHRGSAR